LGAIKIRVSKCGTEKVNRRIQGLNVVEMYPFPTNISDFIPRSEIMRDGGAAVVRYEECAEPSLKG
jgi:hypothetical protein